MEYRYSIEKLHTGSSLGNFFSFVQLDKYTNIHGLWSSLDNSYYLGNMTMAFSLDSEGILPKETIFEPFSQTTIFEGDEIYVSKRIWIPFSDDMNSRREDLQKVFVEVDVRNLSGAKKTFKIDERFLFHAFASPVFNKKPPQEEMDRRYEIRHDAKLLTAHEVSTNRTTRVRFSEVPLFLTNNDEVAHVQFDWNLNPNEARSLRLVVVMTPDNRRHPNDESPIEFKETYLETSHYSLESVLSCSNFVTPSGIINRGIYWAKVNTLRVQHRFKNGFAFTNDPPQDIVVVRDLAWYAMGCDYLKPDFCRSLFDLAEKFCVHQNGKLTEYIHADEDEPFLHDYGLNINDDTPLFILALEHHALVCGDSVFKKRAFELASSAADYIISQLKDGLVYCDAKGVNIWGIASWRNIIDDYNLTGYVTEINSECCAALHSAARLAVMAGEKSMAQKYTAESEKLERNILSKLRKDDSGLFYLNIDQEGKPHGNATGDLVFPVLFGIGDESLRLKIVDRLFEKDFWTDHGARTVAKTDSTYDPLARMNLMGGIWPNLTAWFVMAAKEWYPEKIAQAMEKIYKISESASPVEFGNVVPGEFPERLHGDSFKSMGMGMSPWMPPTYLWLGIEGLLGLKVDQDFIEIAPALPEYWKFLCVFHIPIRERELNVVVFDGTLYIDMVVQSKLPARVGAFNRIEKSSSILVFEFSDPIGKKIFAFSSSGFEGNVSIPVNAHQQNFYLKLNENEMKEILVHEAS